MHDLESDRFRLGLPADCHIQDAQDESKRLSQTEHQKREDLSSKFDSTVWDIKRRIQDEDENVTSRKSQIEADELYESSLLVAIKLANKCMLWIV